MRRSGWGAPRRRCAGGVDRRSPSNRARSAGRSEAGPGAGSQDPRPRRHPAGSRPAAPAPPPIRAGPRTDPPLAPIAVDTAQPAIGQGHQHRGVAVLRPGVRHPAEPGPAPGVVDRAIGIDPAAILGDLPAAERRNESGNPHPHRARHHGPERSGGCIGTVIPVPHEAQGQMRIAEIQRCVKRQPFHRWPGQKGFHLRIPLKAGAGLGACRA